MENNKYIVGSNYFFKTIKGFKSKDIDEVEVINDSKKFKHNFRIKIANKDIIKIVRQDKQEILSYAAKHADGLVFGRFLIPELNKEFDIELEDLKIVEPLISKLDNKHLYFKKIYEYYLENGNMTLTDEQRNAAYEIYKQYRTNK